MRTAYDQVATGKEKRTRCLTVPGMAKARQMRVRRASTGGLSGGQGPTRASHVYLIFRTCPTRLLFGFLTFDLFSFHKPFHPPLT